MGDMKCSSCKLELTNEQMSTSFLCPNCSKSTIIRCKKCRNNATRYECPSCGFTGPN